MEKNKTIKKFNLSMVREKSYKYDEHVWNAHNAVTFLRRLKYDCKPVEVVGAMFLSACGEVIGISEISVGTINSSLFNVRDFITRALLCNAVSMIVWHNHPSGSIDPSDCDIKSTKLLEKACKLMQIRLLDHVILGADKYYSFNDDGRL